MTRVTTHDQVLASPNQTGIWFTEHAGQAGTADPTIASLTAAVASREGQA